MLLTKLASELRPSSLLALLDMAIETGYGTLHIRHAQWTLVHVDVLLFGFEAVCLVPMNLAMSGEVYKVDITQIAIATNFGIFPLSYLTHLLMFLHYMASGKPQRTIKASKSWSNSSHLIIVQFT